MQRVTIGTRSAHRATLSRALASDVWLPRIQAKWQRVLDEWCRDHSGMLRSAISYLKLATRSEGLRTVRAHDALQLADTVLHQRPDDMNALNLAGTARYYRGELDEAQRLLERALAIVPGHSGMTQTLEAVRAAARGDQAQAASA